MLPQLAPACTVGLHSLLTTAMCTRGMTLLSCLLLACGLANAQSVSTMSDVCKVAGIACEADCRDIGTNVSCEASQATAAALQLHSSSRGPRPFLSRACRCLAQDGVSAWREHRCNMHDCRAPERNALPALAKFLRAQYICHIYIYIAR